MLKVIQLPGTFIIESNPKTPQLLEELISFFYDVNLSLIQFKSIKKGTIFRLLDIDENIYQYEPLELWNPSHFDHRIWIKFGKEFINSLSMFRGCLDIMIGLEEGNAKNNLQLVLDDIDKEYPLVKEMRNSIQHRDERVRDRKIYTYVRQNVFTLELRNGSHAEIEMSEITLNYFHQKLKEIIQAFEWIGDKKEYGSFKKIQ